MSQTKETLVLICQLLGCHTPEEQNNIINDLLDVVGQARLLDHQAKMAMRSQSDSNLDLFIKVTGIGEARIKEIAERLTNQQQVKSNH